MKSLTILIFLIAPLHLFASNILLVGDSHTVGPFGWKLDQNLRDVGHSVSTFGSCGSIGQWWFTAKKTTCGYLAINESGQRTEAKEHATPLIENLLSDLRPQMVIIALGSNYVNTPSDDFVRKDLHRLVTTIKDSGAKCFWIAPPDMRSYRKELPRIKKLIDLSVDCPIFDSREVTSYPVSGGDGIHYWSSQGTPIARFWADAVALTIHHQDN